MPYDADGLASLSLTLGIVVVLLWGAVWALRRARSGGISGSGGRDCAVLRSLALGPRERLVVVRVGTRHLVVGVGAASVSLLCELEEPLPPAGAEDGFGTAVRKAMERWRGA
jgi:flagellar protein FliO/FliZ